MNLKPNIYAVLFLFFVLSGFCGLLYQIVWLRLAFAAFGVITPVLSIVLSVFMFGLAIGSWASGKWICPISAALKKPGVWFYAICELLIGIGGILVPWIFVRGQQLLLPLGETDSLAYLALSAVVLGISILPWCVFMGCTFPCMIAFIRQIDRSNRTGFSFLYLANVIGAMMGAILTAGVLIELLGLRATLWTASLCNVSIALVAFSLSRSYPYAFESRETDVIIPIAADPTPGNSIILPIILFVTGFASMAMEVVWTRAFTPVLRTTIYSFAGLLAVYLLATWIGSLLYRRQLTRDRVMSTRTLLGLLAVIVFLPILAEDPRIRIPAFVLHLLPFAAKPESSALEIFKVLVVLLSIFPFCAGLGYLTPKLIDDYSGGSPSRTGSAYAVNVFGCILGPLFAGYVLLPYMGVAQSLRLLAIPFVVGLFFLFRRFRSRPMYTVAMSAVVFGLLVVSIWVATSYEDLSLYYREGMLRRDHVATVLAQGEGRGKRLYVNGIAMTYVTQITKIMAHLPLASLDRPPQSALVICLGMGTTLRSVNSWDIDATAVELVPSVRKVYGYFFPEAEQMLQQPNCRIVIDDGRRFLRRASKKYDLITIDPPPPVEAAGSSLLYSREFYQLIKAHLKDDGVLQQWFPGGEKSIIQAVTRSLTDEFPHVRIFHSIEDWGYHFLASTRPFPKPTVQQFRDRMPESARVDLMEWSEGPSFDDYVQNILSHEIDPAEMLNNDRNVVITDDRPYNEYFLLRRGWHRLIGQYRITR